MSPQAYEIISMLMRYVFVFIGLMIVWRSFRWLRRDARAYRKELRTLPDAGLVGEIVNLATGKAQPLPREGTIGSSRECDIRLKGPGVQRLHARFEFEDGKGLKLIPLRRSSLLLGDMPLRGFGYALHGTQLQAGEVPLRVRLFAGLNVPHPAAYPEPDRVMNEGAVPPLWEEEDDAPPPFDVQNMLPESPNYSRRDMLPESTDYDGDYTPDGQMTWQYAYSVEEMQSAMEEQGQWRQMQPTGQVPDEAEPAPAFSFSRRRRRRDRHA